MFAVLIGFFVGSFAGVLGFVPAMLRRPGAALVAGGLAWVLLSATVARRSRQWSPSSSPAPGRALRLRSRRLGLLPSGGGGGWSGGGGGGGWSGGGGSFGGGGASGGW
jgi:uncharacterized protein